MLRKEFFKLPDFFAQAAALSECTFQSGSKIAPILHESAPCNNGKGSACSGLITDALNFLRNNSAQLPVSWIAPPVETGNHNNPRLFHEEEYPIRESPHSGAPPSLLYYRILQRGPGNLLDCIPHRLREPLPKLRKDTFVPRQCFFQFCVRLRQPNNRKRHRRLNRSALTCSHGMTSEGF